MVNGGLKNLSQSIKGLIVLPTSDAVITFMKVFILESAIVGEAILDCTGFQLPNTVNKVTKLSYQVNHEMTSELIVGFFTTMWKTNCFMSKNCR